MSRPRDGGTVLPLLVVCVVLAVTVLAASTAGAAALLARRRLAADCDAAALAGAAALDRTALATPATGEGQAAGEGRTVGEGRTAGEGTAGGGRAGGPGGDRLLPLDGRAADAAVRAAVPVGTGVETRLDGGVLTVRCHRTVRVPFGAVLGRKDGIDRTAVTRAGTRTRPST